MRELSFVIPIRVDTEDRLENCNAVLGFLSRHFPQSEIQLIEHDQRTRTAQLRARHPGVVWHFEHSTGRFNKSAATNIGLLRATRPCVCMYDTDVLVGPAALVRAARLILTRRWPIVIPFNLVFIEVSGATRRDIMQNPDDSPLMRVARLADIPVHSEISSRMLSGALMMCDRDLIVREGGYNKKMVSYGWEDMEFFERFKKLGYYSILIADYSVVHLEHRRGPDSWINEFYPVNRAEFERVTLMSTPKLRAYVTSDLRIDPGVNSEALRAQRRGQRVRNHLTFRALVHNANKLAVHWRVHGTQGILRKIVHLRAAQG